jgi:hypothetical protein
MKKMLLAFLTAATFAVPALAETPTPTPSPTGTAATPSTQPLDGMMTKGPMSRMPKKERQDKKELETFFKSWNDDWKNGDANALAAMVDFPVLMLTDDSSGNYNHSDMTQDQWLGVMGPMVAKSGAKNAAGAEETKHWSNKSNCTMLSDDLASCLTEVSVSMHKMKGNFRRETLMTRTGTGWKIKSMVEAGWGDMHPASASN